MLNFVLPIRSASNPPKVLPKAPLMNTINVPIEKNNVASPLGYDKI